VAACARVKTAPRTSGVAVAAAAAADVIPSTIPVVVALLSWLILKERPNGRALASIALAIVGVVVINLAHVDQSAGGETSFTGNAAGGVVNPEA
jgi:drug/metabolite transporter (DMT)-like permease